MFSFGIGPTAGVGATSPYTPGNNASPLSGEKSAKEAFLEYARMTPAERLRDSILKSLDLTEDDLKRMTVDERLQVEEQIKEMIKQKVEEDGGERTGAIVDLKA